MRKIILSFDESGFKKIAHFMYLRQITENVVGPDYHCLALILTAITNKVEQLNISGKLLDKLDEQD